VRDRSEPIDRSEPADGSVLLAPPPLRTVALLVHPGLSMFELGVACEVFGIDRSAEGLPTFELTVCTEHPPVVPTAAGLDLSVPHDLSALTGADLVILAPASTGTTPSSEVVAALRRAVDAGSQVVSLCSASFILARAGLLEGRRCTTHWFHADAFREEFPGVDLVPDVLYVEDGPIATSAGTAAAIDLCLHLVRRSHGAAAASGIARRMVVPPHRDGGQAQFVRTPVSECSAETLAGVLEWAGRHLDDDLTVARLAERAGLSERTFARRFRDETGTTPHHWVTAQRVALAEDLLEGGVDSMEEVARRCGFGSAGMLRHHFTRLRSTTPTAYRRTFCGRTD
jgi:AraC family transcriptional regulator, transcriptional activator FtrA